VPGGRLPGAVRGMRCRVKYLVTAAVVTAAAVRAVRSRHQRSLHPDGRSFTGELTVTGLPGTGAALLERPGRHPVTLRISKGVGTRPGFPDLFGVAIRVHGPVCGHKCDLLFSTAGSGRFSRHVPMPRRGFDTVYGSILAYRTGTGRKLYLSARPDPDARPLGRTLESVVTAAERDGARLILMADDEPFGSVRFGPPLPAEVDAALAFNPVTHTGPDLHPTGLVHASRAVAYRLSQRWRGVRPSAADPDATARTAAHR
jgi:hypothetical protein